MELFFGWLHRLVKIGRVLKSWPGHLELGEGKDQDALYRRRIDCDARGAQSPVEQYLCKQTAEGMAHDDRRPIHLPNDAVVVVDDLRDAEAGDLIGVAAQILDAALHPGPGGRHHFVASFGVAIDPVLPAERG